MPGTALNPYHSAPLGTAGVPLILHAFGGSGVRMRLPLAGAQSHRQRTHPQHFHCGRGARSSDPTCCSVALRRLKTQLLSRAVPPLWFGLTHQPPPPPPPPPLHPFPPPHSEETYIVDEAITLFRANVLRVPFVPLPHLPKPTSPFPPPPVTHSEETDIVDEAITLFRANVLFRRFDIRGPADKLLVYLTLYINMALKRIDSCPSEAEGIRLLINLGLEPFPIPGDPGFPLAGLFATPTSRLEAETLRTYLQSVREETSNRLLQLVYLPDGSPNKWWLSFSKRKFMNVAMPL
ncbi:unnamed protein product [Closterium sp. Naga37s-1]|nr:unnamed protein product [Closterium sp. Naga37s-1]